MEERHAERRQYARVHLRAYGFDKVCILVHGEMRCHVDLVDISAGGARLRLQAPLPETWGNALQFSVNGVDDKGVLQNLDAQIRWRNGLEIGVQFVKELQLTAGELQKLVGA